MNNKISWLLVKLRHQLQLHPRPCFSSPSPRSHNTSNWAASWKKKKTTTKWHVRPAKTQIRPVWSESLLCAQWVAKDPSFLRADSEERMPRLVWVFAERICRFVGFCHEAARICLVYVCHYLLPKDCWGLPDKMNWKCINKTKRRPVQTLICIMHSSKQVISRKHLKIMAFYKLVYAPEDWLFWPNKVLVYREFSSPEPSGSVVLSL